MEIYFTIIVGILFVFAISDLVVGVANDAVNFLNSAIGARAGSFKLLMTVASIGVLVGALFSGGMMEIARSGIFHPSEFYFHEVMLLFLAVMITDVLLLNFFNTYGLPTSTTVSLVFELLGAAFVFSIIKINHNNETLLELGKYINSDKAFAIIGAIFISIAVAFIFGFFTMWLARLYFTFNFEKKMPFSGSIFSGISIAVICYFIFIKGLKDVSFVPPQVLFWIKENILLVLGTIAGGISLIFIILQLFVKINVFRIVVLFGTFALAMAFAGNDLVNFIGVPMAGYKSFQIYMESGATDPETFSMELLAQPVKTEFIFLFLSGVVMILTLWFSKKARTVIQTSVNLSKQKDTGEEQFGANQLSITIVRFFYNLGQFLRHRYLRPIVKAIDKRFEPLPEKENEIDPPAFDMLRAALNLMVASSLIALGTSLKLPLSTTYVTFMVAMATSLADRAWGRESAVYRISGVFAVVGGWFLTAFVAFSVSSLIALFLWWGDMYAVAIVIPLALLIMYRTHLIYKKNEQQKKEKQEIIKTIHTNKVSVAELSRQTLEEVICELPVAIENVFQGLKTEDIVILKNTTKKIKEIDFKTESQKTAINQILNTEPNIPISESEHFLKINETLRGIIVSLNFIARPAYQHIKNLHKTLGKNQLNDFEALKNELIVIIEQIRNNLISNTKNPEEYKNITHKLDKFINKLDDARLKQIQRIKKKENPSRSSLLFFNIISELKVLSRLLIDIISIELQKDTSIQK